MDFEIRADRSAQGPRKLLRSDRRPHGFGVSRPAPCRLGHDGARSPSDGSPDDVLTTFGAPRGVVGRNDFQLDPRVRDDLVSGRRVLPVPPAVSISPDVDPGDLRCLLDSFVRRASQNLTERGMVRAVHGKGTFVTEPKLTAGESASD